LGDDEEEDDDDFLKEDIPEYDEGTAYGCDKCGDCEDWLDIEATTKAAISRTLTQERSNNVT